MAPSQSTPHQRGVALPLETQGLAIAAVFASPKMQELNARLLTKATATGWRDRMRERTRQLIRSQPELLCNQLKDAMKGEVLAQWGQGPCDSDLNGGRENEQRSFDQVFYDGYEAAEFVDRMIVRDSHPNNGYPIDMAVDFQVFEEEPIEMTVDPKVLEKKPTAMAVDPKVFEEKHQLAPNGGSSKPSADVSLPRPMMVELLGSVRDAWNEIVYPPGRWDGRPLVDRTESTVIPSQLSQGNAR